MNVQEQEDLDYQMGMASELQNALALSRMEFEDDRAKVAELVCRRAVRGGLPWSNLLPPDGRYHGGTLGHP